MKQLAGNGGVGSGCACLAYHELTPERPKYLYSVCAADFAKQVRLAREWSARPGRETCGPQLTFDDGHVSQYELAFPILKELSSKAVFFVTGGWINARAGYVTWKQLEEMVKAGFEVQSHGWSHEYLPRCDEVKLERELRRSKEEVENRLGVEVTAISMPGGRWNRKVVRACRQAGYTRVYTSDPFFAPKTEDGITVVGRTMVTKDMDEARISMALKGEATTGMRAGHYAKRTARALVGDQGYQLLWRALARKRESLENAGAGEESEIDAVS